MTEAQLSSLAYFVKAEIREDFKHRHLSGNLMETIRVGKTPDGFEVEIPAEIYDMYEFQMTGAIVYTGEGSYANQLDIAGSEFWTFYLDGSRRYVKPHNHINYAENAIKRAVDKWMKSIHAKGEITYL